MILPLKGKPDDRTHCFLVFFLFILTIVRFTMLRNGANQTVLQPSASGKKQQKKTNVTAGKETGRPGIKPKDAYEAWRKSRVLKGGKVRRSGISVPIDESHTDEDPTEEEYNSQECTTSDDESDDESTELTTNIVEPSLPVHNKRHETIVFFDIKDVPVPQEDDPLPLGLNENYSDFSFQHNGAVIKVRDETRPPERKRPGRQGRVTLNCYRWKAFALSCMRNS